MIQVQCKLFDFTLAEILCVSAECPDNWVRHADSCYLFINRYIMEWIDAMVSFLLKYCRFLILREYITPRFNHCTSSRENMNSRIKLS